jgi:protocatechuate 3,4-dioxygenase beta subunit
VLGIVISAVVIAAIIPVAYAGMQRAAITSLKFDFDRIELTDVDLSETTAGRSLQQVISTLERPSSTSLTHLVALESDISSISSPEGFLIDVIANTRLTFSMFVKVQNPSSFEAVIDRALVKVSINNRELPNSVEVSQQARIPPGGETTVEISGISLSGKEVALILVNMAANDFILSADFAVISYFPALLGEVPIPANLNLDIFLVPPKPSLSGNSGGFSQVSLGSNSYELSFINKSPVPLNGKFQVGVLKGNFLSEIGLCNPNCIAPIDNGLATFIRLNLGSNAGIQVFERDNVLMTPTESFSFTVDNPQLRSKENSAFIIRWSPDYSLTPYRIHTQIAGVESTKQGQFSSESFSPVKKIAYNIIRDFGYVGSREFVAPDTSTHLSLVSSTHKIMEGERVNLSGRLVDTSSKGIASAQIRFYDEDTGSRDESLGTAITNSDGEFTFSWRATDTDFFDNTIELFASYSGSSTHSESRSNPVAIGIANYIPPETYLTLSSSDNSGYEGETVFFVGVLTDENGDPVSDKQITLHEEDTGSLDEYLGSTFTDSGGRYTLSWVVEDTDFWDNSLELFASYPGSNSFASARSEFFSFEILSTPTDAFEPESINTNLFLESSESSVYEGQTIIFTGRLITHDGEPLSNALVHLKDEDPASGDDDIGSLTTGSDGQFSFSWDARQMDPYDNSAEVYAIFEGNQFYENSRSSEIAITVFAEQTASPEGEQDFQYTNIDIISSDTSVNEGELITFAGTLYGEDEIGIPNAIIEIMDDDTGSGHDLIATIVTDSQGRYDLEWTSRQMDPFDNQTEVYARFQGSDLYGSAKSITIVVTVN